MRRVMVSNLKEGMVLAKPVYSHNSIVLLSEGITLSEKYIDKIVSAGVLQIFIEDDISEGIDAEVYIREDVKVEVKKVLQASIGKMKSGQFTESPEVTKKIEAIVNEVINNPNVMINVQELRNKSDYYLMHAMNVCILSVVLGRKMGYTDTQLKQLAMGAVLHDVGKIRLSQECLRYRTDYIDQEWDAYKQHVNLGYEIAIKISNSALVSANVIRMHHENFDGTGFPLGLKGVHIHEFARIVAIANEYDSLLYTSPFGKKMKHYEIIEFIVSKAYREFDPKIIKVFSETIAPYPIGTGIVLSDGRIAIVSKLNISFPTRPFIRILNSDLTTVLEEIDLSKAPSLLIVDEKDIDKR